MDLDKYVQVLLPIPIYQEFTYEIPVKWQGSIFFGQRVLVQFGSRRIISGLVWETHNKTPEKEVKEISGVLDNLPIINKQQKMLWDWMADYYICSSGEVMKAALPAGFKLESHTRLIANEQYVSNQPLAETEELAWLFIQKNPGTSIHDLGEVLKRKNPLPIIHQLNNKGAIFLEEKLANKYSVKTETYYELTVDFRDEKNLQLLLDSLKRAPKQQDILEALISKSTDIADTDFLQRISRKELLELNTFSASALKGLLQKEIIDKVLIKISRLSNPDKSASDPKPLNESQLLVFKNIQSHKQDSVHLIHGITSSGKTEVYIHLIKSHLDKGEQVLYLLPEIALTEQIIRRLQEVFGDIVGVFHSKYTDSERIELWRDLLDENKYKLILGARSAIFLPYKKLGLVIIDEEHETSFKQHDPAPRYNARDSAIVMAKIHEAQVVMGTATPSLESYYNARSGKFVLHNLDKRYGNIPLPEIIIANIKEAYRKKKNQGHFTPELLDAIDQALVNKEQIILFQNRRGYSPYLECDTCGHIPKCRDCDVSLTLHKFRDKIVCHYCGYTEPAHSQCPSCNNNSMRTKGLGTEGLEDEIGIIFPDARISRLDIDTSRTRKGYSRIIAEFEEGKTDILVGTQMITKGLDFSRVRVVGILNADNMLHFPDFRSFERSYQLMTQVSGRAGRRDDQGLVVIQTYDPTHRIIRQVLKNDYTGLYQNELQERMSFAYPPFTRLIRLLIKHKDPEILNRCAYYLSKELKDKWGTRILGPQAPGISRIQQYHIRHILIKSPKGLEHKEIRGIIRQLIKEMKTDKIFRSVIIHADVDPL